MQRLISRISCVGDFKGLTKVRQHRWERSGRANEDGDQYRLNNAEANIKDILKRRY